MAEKKRSTGLKSRTYEALENRQNSTRYNTVAQWIRELPLINLGETACLVHNALNYLGGTRMTHRERAKILALFEEPISYVTTTLHKRYIGHAFPLAEDQQILVNFERKLHQNLVDGYRSVIPRAASTAFLTSGTTMLARVIERSLYHYFGIMLTYYQTYTPVPANLWRDIHKLYYLGETFQLGNKRLAGKSDDYSGSTSIAMTYKRILLTALAGPYHLSQFDIADVVGLLEDWPIPCPLSKRSTGTTQSLFAVDLFCDEAPRAIEQEAVPASKSRRFLDTAKLTEMLRNEIRKVPRAAHNPHQKKNRQELFDHLMLSWGIVPKRNRKRSSRKLNTQAAIGLRTIHYFVDQDMRTGQSRHGKIIPIMTARPSQYCTQLESESGEGDMPLHLKSVPELNVRAHYDSQSIFSQSNPDNSPDIWDSVFPQAKYHGLDLTETDLCSDHDKSVPPHINSCLMRNNSVNGACLVWEGEGGAKIRIGELIGLRLMVARKIQWTIGVIRWMKNINDCVFEFGVQYLAPACEAVALATKTDGSGAAFYQRALLCGNVDDGKKRKATLIVAGSSGNAGTPAQLNVSGVEYSVALMDVIDSTWLFSHYSFDIAVTENDASSTVDKNLGESELDRVWALL